MLTDLQKGISLSVLLALSLFLVSCDSGGSGSEDGPDTLIPLEEGDQWTVNGTEGERVTLEVTNSTTVNVLDTEQVVKVENRSDGILVRGIPSEPGQSGMAVSDPAMLLKYPVEDGETYQHTDGKPSTFDVTVSMESVIVPAGEFDCILYDIERQRQGGNYRNDVDKVWVKPGLGPVRSQDEDGESASLVSTNVQ